MTDEKKLPEDVSTGSPAPPEIEYLDSGIPIYHHKTPVTNPEIVRGDRQNSRYISQHIEQHIGKSSQIFHELVSPLVHVDIHVVPPSHHRDYYTLVTAGMSERGMNVPKSASMYRHAELVMCLPPDWKLSHDDFQDEANYWPVRWLKILARMPHEYNTWLGLYHTIPNGDPPQPFASNTDLCCAFLMRPALFDEGFWYRHTPDGRTIHFYSLIPIYRSEITIKLRQGGDVLAEKLTKLDVTELLDIDRLAVT